MLGATAALICTIIVNTSTVGWNSSLISHAKLRRANKDGEVAALCLLIFWQSKEAADPAEASKRLMDTVCDMAFECQSCGSGSAFESRKLLLIETEEKKTECERCERMAQSIAVEHASCDGQDRGSSC